MRLPEDIAEVFYNRALNYIMQENYAKAEHDLLMAMKVIEKLHLNSLRVCNLSNYMVFSTCEHHAERPV